MLITRTPVRVSFAGGGTDLPVFYEKYGGAVLSTTINKHFYTILTGRDDDLIQIISADIRVAETWRNIASIPTDHQTELEIPFAVLKSMDCKVGLNLFLASEIPPGTGLGSSATVCVNLLRGISQYLRRSLSRYKIAETAFQIAREVLKKPVGKQDEYAAAFGGLNHIRFEAGSTSVERLELPLDSLRRLEQSLLLYFTGAQHNSWAILEEQEKSSAQAGGQTVEALLAIKELVEQMKDALLAGDFHSFGRLLDVAWQHKKRLSSRISNDRIDMLYDLAKSKGALGGKITGAGGGGFLLLYCEPENQPQLIEAMKDAGLRQMHFSFDLAGSQVIYDDPFLEQDPRGGSQWSYIPAEALSELLGSTWKR